MSQISISTRNAVLFVVLMGIVSLFSDMTYEGARSINGSYLAILGASGVIVGAVAGAGEWIGFSIRLLSGYLSDKTRNFWIITFFGYAINLLAVPLLALVGSWQMAALLMVIERIGKGIRVPPRDAMLSYATQRMGRGWGFGLHEALDQIGAISGPLIVAAVLYFRNGYQTGYLLLFLPALLALGTLAMARFLYPRPQDLEIHQPHLQFQGFSRTFWLYLSAASLIAAGFADFLLVAYHLQKNALAQEALIPVLYAIAMAVDALAALFFGRLFDRFGLSILILVAALSAFFAPLVFLGSLPLVLVGMALWGIGMGAQESILRAAIANMIAPEQRGTAYGLFNMFYGISWFLGSLLLGFLYDRAFSWMIAFSVLAQLLAIPIFASLHRARPVLG